ncbi:MAG: hypothetical protein NTZ78_08855 [Candidatus Aureabacteria bacterium]|nr:hypothetical protein [Candidatus Auribacterota bacterium]
MRKIQFFFMVMVLAMLCSCHNRHGEKRWHEESGWERNKHEKSEKKDKHHHEKKEKWEHEEKE